MTDLSTPERREWAHLYLRAAVSSEDEKLHDWDRINCTDEEFARLMGKQSLEQAEVELTPIVETAVS